MIHYNNFSEPKHTFHMITFRRIFSPTDSYYSQMTTLYESSFLYEQRRELHQLKHEMLTSKHFYVHALLADSEFVGFINYWQFHTFCFVEHFAITPQLRGKKLGSKVLSKLKDTVTSSIVFEVDTPTSDVAARRIEFYERAGFHIIPNDYLQPPYRPSDIPFPLLIMTDNQHFVSKHFDSIKKTIYKEVYHYE